MCFLWDCNLHAGRGFAASPRVQNRACPQGHASRDDLRVIGCRGRAFARQPPWVPCTKSPFSAPVLWLQKELCPFLSREAAPLPPGLLPITPSPGGLPSALSVPPGLGIQLSCVLDDQGSRDLIISRESGKLRCIFCCQSHRGRTLQFGEKSIVACVQGCASERQIFIEECCWVRGPFSSPSPAALPHCMLLAVSAFTGFIFSSVCLKYGVPLR